MFQGGRIICALLLYLTFSIHVRQAGPNEWELGRCKHRMPQQVKLYVKKIAERFYAPMLLCQAVPHEHAHACVHVCASNLHGCEIDTCYFEGIAEQLLEMSESPRCAHYSLESIDITLQRILECCCNRLQTK